MVQHVPLGPSSANRASPGMGCVDSKMPPSPTTMKRHSSPSNLRVTSEMNDLSASASFSKDPRHSLGSHSVGGSSSAAGASFAAACAFARRSSEDLETPMVVELPHHWYFLLPALTVLALWCFGPLCVCYILLLFLYYFQEE